MHTSITVLMVCFPVTQQTAPLLSITMYASFTSTHFKGSSCEVSTLTSMYKFHSYNVWPNCTCVYISITPLKQNLIKLTTLHSCNTCNNLNSLQHLDSRQTDMCPCNILFNATLYLHLPILL